MLPKFFIVVNFSYVQNQTVLHKSKFNEQIFFRETIWQNNKGTFLGSHEVDNKIGEKIEDGEAGTNGNIFQTIRHVKVEKFFYYIITKFHFRLAFLYEFLIVSLRSKLNEKEFRIFFCLASEQKKIKLDPSTKITPASKSFSIQENRHCESPRFSRRKTLSHLQFQTDIFSRNWKNLTSTLRVWYTDSDKQKMS